MKERRTAPISDLFERMDFMVMDFSSLQMNTKKSSNITIWVNTKVRAWDGSPRMEVSMPDAMSTLIP